MKQFFTQPPKILTRVEHEISVAFVESLKFSQKKQRSLILFLCHELNYFFLTRAALNILLKQSDGNESLASNLKMQIDALRFGYRGNNSVYQNPATWKTKVFNTVFKFTIGVLFRQKLLVGRVSESKRAIISAFLRHGYLPQYCTQDLRVGFEFYEDQKNILFSLIKKLSHMLALTEADQAQLISDIHKLLDKHTYPTERLMKGSNDICIIGTPGYFFNRLIAFKAHQENKAVIGMLHGAESGNTILPSWGFDDWACCDHLIGYSNGGLLLTSEKSYKYYAAGTEYYTSGNPEIWNIARNSQETVNALKPIKSKSPKGLFLEKRYQKRFSIINAIGFYDPSQYLDWKRLLLRRFETWDYKTHPKGVLEDVGISPDRIIHGNLKDVALSYDFFIIDDATSTAFSIIAATDKPIILILRNNDGLTDAGLKAIHKRCHVISANGRSYEEIFTDIEKLKPKKLENIFTPAFSLKGDYSSRLQALPSIVRNIKKI